MKVSNKKTLCALLLASGIMLACAIWMSLRPVNIVAVHEDRHFSDILVKNFPFTDQGKIDWWMKNKDILKEKYDIPKPKSDGSFTIIIWLFGDGYKETDGYDSLCFDDMKTELNCIEKNAVFAVRQYHDDDVIFATYEGRYSLNKSGDIIKIKSE